MSVVTIPRADVSGEEVVKALRVALGERYEVLQGHRIPRNLFGRPRPGQGDGDIVVIGSSGLSRVQLSIHHEVHETQIKLRPGGLTLGPLLINTLGIARTVSRALQHAPGLRASS
jgi:hypothetical protein